MPSTVSAGGLPCDLFQSLQTSWRTSSTRVVDGNPVTSVDARATRTRSCESLTRSLLDWPAGRACTRRTVVLDGI